MKKITQVIVAALAVLAIASAAQAVEPGATAYGRITKSNLPPLPADWKNPAHQQQEPVVPLNERYLVKPILDTPMRAPSICKGPAGTYYLTGTLGSEIKNPKSKIKNDLDFDNGNVIRLWKSTDLETWTDLGVVSDPLKGGGKAISPAVPWGERFGVLPLRVEKRGDQDIFIDVEDNPSDEQKRIMGGGQIAEVKTVIETLEERR